MNERISQGTPRATFPLLSFLSFLLSLCPRSGWICGSQDKVLRVAHKTKRDCCLGTADGFGSLWMLKPMLNSAKPKVDSGPQDRRREGRKDGESSVLVSASREFLSFHSTHPDVLPSNFSCDNLKRFL